MADNPSAPAGRFFDFGANPQGTSGLGTYGQFNLPFAETLKKRPLSKTTGTKALGETPYIPSELMRIYGIKPVHGTGIAFEQRVTLVRGVYSFSQQTQQIAAHLRKSIHIGRIVQENADRTYDVQIKTSSTSGGVATDLIGVSVRNNLRPKAGEFVIVVFFDGDKIKPTIINYAPFKIGETIITINVTCQVV